MNLFVSNIDFEVTEAELKELFAQYGTIKNLKILQNPETGKGKGYGFVLMSSSYEGQKACMRLNKTVLNGRALSVQEAKPRPGGELFVKKERVLRPRRKKKTDEGSD